MNAIKPAQFKLWLHFDFSSQGRYVLDSICYFITYFPNSSRNALLFVRVLFQFGFIAVHKTYAF